MKELILVCTGNTCRSPMAEGLGLKYLDNRLKIRSRGLSVSIGLGANSKSIVAMDMEGIDIRGHVAKRFDINEVSEDTLILGMTRGHKDHLLAYFPELKGRVYTILEYIGVAGQVADPYGGDQDTYNQCAKLLKKAIIKLNQK